MACKLFGNNGSTSGEVNTSTPVVWEVPEDICRILLVMEGGMDNIRNVFNTGSGTVQVVFDVTPGETFKLVYLTEGGAAPTQNSRQIYYASRGSGGLAFLPESDPLQIGYVWAAVGGSGGILLPYDIADNKYAGQYKPGGNGGGDVGGSAYQDPYQNTGGIGGSQIQAGNWNGAAFAGGSYYDERRDVPVGGAGGGGGYYGGGGGGTDNPLNPQYDCSTGSGGGGSSYINIPASRNPVTIENSQGTSGKVPGYYRNFYTIRW